jgi:hypothetical protein
VEERRVTTPEPTPKSIAAKLAVAQRLLLFCVASGTDHRKAGVNSASVQLAIFRGLVKRSEATQRLALTDHGRAVLAALLSRTGEA